MAKSDDKHWDDMRYPIQSENDREVSDCIMVLRPTDRKQHIDVGHTVFIVAY